MKMTTNKFSHNKMWSWTTTDKNKSDNWLTHNMTWSQMITVKIKVVITKIPYKMGEMNK